MVGGFHHAWASAKPCLFSEYQYTRVPLSRNARITNRVRSKSFRLSDEYLHMIKTSHVAKVNWLSNRRTALAQPGIEIDDKPNLTLPTHNASCSMLGILHVVRDQENRQIIET
jgi:hypothetical protein